MRTTRVVKQRRGAVAMLVIIGMTVLLGMLAVSIDMGQVVIAAQRAQDVADASALAALSQPLNAGQSGALLRIADMVGANNIQAPLQVNYDPQAVEFHAAGSEIPGYGTLEGSDEAATVVTSVPVTYRFAQALGLEGTTVVRQATALRQQGGGGGCALFAHGHPHEPYSGIRWNGSHINVNGSAWSNADLEINGGGSFVDGNLHGDRNVKIVGSGNTVTGKTEWVNHLHASGNQDINPVHVANPDPKDWPASWEVSEFSFDYVRQGNWSVKNNDTLNPGIHYVNGNVDINANHHSLLGITIVATGRIIISGGNAGPASPAANSPDGVLYFSLASHSEAINVNGAKGTWEGTFFAPNGGVRYNGGGQTVKDGSILAKSIRFNGQGFEMLSSVPMSPGGAPSIRLIR